MRVSRHATYNSPRPLWFGSWNGGSRRPLCTWPRACASSISPPGHGPYWMRTDAYVEAPSYAEPLTSLHGRVSERRPGE
eukprot:9118586-Lingulodinium_polyedra.AAC.1